MVTCLEIGSRLLEIVERSPGCDLEEVVAECPDLTWNQVFLELDRMSRAGLVILKQSRRGHYRVVPCKNTAQRVTQFR